MKFQLLLRCGSTLPVDNFLTFSAILNSSPTIHTVKRHAFSGLVISAFSIISRTYASQKETSR
jgi:hypothetical protein